MAPGKKTSPRVWLTRGGSIVMLFARAQAGQKGELALLLRRGLTGLDVLVADAEHAAVSDQITPDQVAAVSPLSA